MTQHAPLLPSFSAFVGDDSTGEVTINGVRQLVAAPDEAGVREEIIARVTSAAIGSGGPVRLIAEDSQGQSPLIVYPDGRVEADGDFIPASERRPAEDAAPAPAAGPTPTVASPLPSPISAAKPTSKPIPTPMPKSIPAPMSKPDPAPAADPILSLLA